jgi:hypothetical protein
VRSNNALIENSHNALLPTLTFSIGAGIRHRDIAEAYSKKHYEDKRQSGSLLFFSENINRLKEKEN